jgi:aryl-alcohol dehydrogenase-like predicted oxidoreductase
MPFCAEHRIAVVSSMTLQQGVLTGKYRSAADVPAHQAHSRHFSMAAGKGTSRHGEAGAEAEIFETVAVLRDIAADLKITMTQLSIAWALANPGIASALIGARNTSELEENVKVLSLKLPREAKERLDGVSQKVLDKLGSNPDYYENSKNSRIY